MPAGRQKFLKFASFGTLLITLVLSAQKSELLIAELQRKLDSIDQKLDRRD